MSDLFQSSWYDIEAEWIDYNNHFNMGYYTVLFDRAADEAYAALGFGPDYKSRTGYTTYAAEFHVTYLRELKLGDRVRMQFRIIDFDEKRFHTFQEMHHVDGWLAATGEGMALHVNTAGPKVAPMPREIQNNLKAMKLISDGFSRPDAAGRSIGLRR